LRQGISLWFALMAGCGLTILLNFLMLWLGRRIGLPI
jgi:hypothetical protein